MMIKYTLSLLAVFALTGCGSTDSSGYRIHHNQGQPVIFLEDDSTLLVRPADSERPLLLVGMNSGTLSVIQLDADGKTPFSVEFADHSPSRIVIEQKTEDGSSMIMDKDGDGIPDVLIKHTEDNTVTEGFVRESIDWNIKESK